MEDNFFTLDTKDQLDEIVMRLYDFTHPNEGMEDYIFFDKNEAMIFLKEHFDYIDFDEINPTDEEDIQTFNYLMEEIESMNYFIAFKTDNINDFFVDDYTGYINDLFKQIMESAEYLEEMLRR